MHPLAVSAIVKTCRQRLAEGDCPTVAAPGKEALEDCIIELASMVDRLPAAPKPMVLISQRTPHDCGICCIAMATGKSYDEVMAAALKKDGTYNEGGDRPGLRSEHEVLRELGYTHRFDNGRLSAGSTFSSMHRGFMLSVEFFRTFAWGRRALMCVPSLNREKGWHAIYWDGLKIWDPSPEKTYTDFYQLLPEEMVLFHESNR